MSRARIYLKNLAANWFGYGFNLIVIFFLSPFVVHTLGDINYGVWSLMMSLTGYLGLVEMGTRAGIGRFINFYLGKDDIKSVNEIISTGMMVILMLGAVLLLAGIVLAILLPLAFPKIPDDLVPSARVVAILIATNLWMSFLSSPFRQVLTAYERFELINGVDLLVLAARSVGTVVALLAGGGLVTLAVIQVAGSILGQATVQLLSRRIFPQLRINKSLASWRRFRELFGFSIWAFVGEVAMNLLYSADAIVIAVLLGPQWVTYYTIGGMLLIYVRMLISQAVSIFTPRILQDCAREDWDALRTHFRRGSNMAIGIGILLLVGMIVFGREFIILWMGQRFAVSYNVLVLLASSSIPAIAFMMAGPFYPGLNRVKLSSLLTFSQGLLNLGLTVYFVVVLEQGIIGVAWGTFYPRIVFAVVGGLIALRWIHFSFREFLTSQLPRWMLLGVGFYASASIVEMCVQSNNWAAFFVKIAVAVGVYLVLVWSVLLDSNARAWGKRSLTRQFSVLFARS